MPEGRPSVGSRPGPAAATILTSNCAWRSSLCWVKARTCCWRCDACCCTLPSWSFICWFSTILAASACMVHKMYMLELWFTGLPAELHAHCMFTVVLHYVQWHFSYIVLCHSFHQLHGTQSIGSLPVLCAGETFWAWISFKVMVTPWHCSKGFVTKTKYVIWMSTTYTVKSFIFVGSTFCEVMKLSTFVGT